MLYKYSWVSIFKGTVQLMQTTHWKSFYKSFSSLLAVRRTLKNGLTPEEALALGLTDSPDTQTWPSSLLLTVLIAVETQLRSPERHLCPPPAFATLYGVVFHLSQSPLGFCQLLILPDVSEWWSCSWILVFLFLSFFFNAKQRKKCQFIIYLNIFETLH